MKVNFNTNSNMCTLQVNNSTLFLHKNNGRYTNLNTDFIVNPAKPDLEGGGGLDKVIHQEGGSDILKACKKIKKVRGSMRCPTGEAKITKSGNLKQVAVVHTVGPKLKKQKSPPTKQQKNELKAAYSHTLKAADVYAKYVQNPGAKHDKWLDKIKADKNKTAALQNRLNNGKSASITLCCISTGSYSYPADKASKVAIKTIVDFIKQNPTSSLKEFHISCCRGQKDIPHLERAMKSVK